MASILDERGFNQGFKLTEAQQIRLRRRAESIIVEMNLPSDPEARKRIHILELGCGTGELAYHLAQLTGARVTGVDLSEKFIARAAATYVFPNLNFVVANLATETPASADEQYHYIVGNGILHHLYYHLDSFLPALARWLTPGGRLIFWEPNLRNPYIFLIFTFSLFRRLARLEPDEMAFGASFISSALTRAGFTAVSAPPRDFLLPNTPARLVPATIALSNHLERWPLVRWWSQSLFISATKPKRP